MVTDGQIPNPSPQLLDRIAAARSDLGLEVHGLIVGDKTQVLLAITYMQVESSIAGRWHSLTVLVHSSCALPNGFAATSSAW